MPGGTSGRGADGGRETLPRLGTMAARPLVVAAGPRLLASLDANTGPRMTMIVQGWTNLTGTAQGWTADVVAVCAQVIICTLGAPTPGEVAILGALLLPFHRALRHAAGGTPGRVATRNGRSEPRRTRSV